MLQSNENRDHCAGSILDNKVLYWFSYSSLEIIEFINLIEFNKWNTFFVKSFLTSGAFRGVYEISFKNYLIFGGQN